MQRYYLFLNNLTKFTKKKSDKSQNSKKRAILSYTKSENLRICPSKLPCIAIIGLSVKDLGFFNKLRFFPTHLLYYIYYNSSINTTILIFLI